MSRLLKTGIISGVVSALIPLAISCTPCDVLAKTTITVWGWTPDIKAVADEYMKIAPGINIKVVQMDWRLVHDKLLTTMVAGTQLPDVTMVDVFFITRFVNQHGLFAELGQYGMGAFKSKFIDSRWKLASLKGRIYAAPLDTGPLAIIYRPEVLAAAGLPVESSALSALAKDWNQFTQLSRKIVKDTNADGKNDIFALSTGKMIEPIMRQQVGARVFDEELKVMMDKDDLPKWVDTWKTALAYKNSGFDSTIGYRWEVNFSKSFKQNKLAFAAEAIWWLPETIKIGGQWGVMPLPLKVGANSGGSFLAIPAGAKKKKEAWAFIKYVCANERTQLYLLKKAGWFPVWKPAYDEPEFNMPYEGFGNQKVFRVFADSAETTKYLPVSRFDEKASEIITSQLDKVWSGKDLTIAIKDAAQAIRSASRGAK